jgi:hypothetical protein
MRRHFRRIAGDGRRTDISVRLFFLKLAARWQNEKGLS